MPPPMIRRPLLCSQPACSEVSIPIDTSDRTARGVSPSPQTFSRGNEVFSSSSTSWPARARWCAVAEPPGPAPTTMTSASRLAAGCTMATSTDGSGCACELIHEGGAASVYGAGRGPAEGPVQRTGPSDLCSAGRSVLEGVLDVLARLLEVGFGLVPLAFTAKLVVAGTAAAALLGVSGDLLDLVVGLVIGTHGGLRSSSTSGSLAEGPLAAVAVLKPLRACGP